MNNKNIEDMIKKNPFANELGMELITIEKGYAKGKMPFTSKCENPYHTMHGGCSYALADTIAGIAAISYGYYVTTVDADIHYLLPVAETQYVYCEAREVRQGKTLGIYDVSITNDKGDLLIKGTFTYYRLNQKIEFEIC